MKMKKSRDLRPIILCTTIRLSVNVGILETSVKLVVVLSLRRVCTQRENNCAREATPENQLKRRKKKGATSILKKQFAHKKTSRRCNTVYKLARLYPKREKRRWEERDRAG